MHSLRWKDTPMHFPILLKLLIMMKRCRHPNLYQLPPTMNIMSNSNNTNPEKSLKLFVHLTSFYVQQSLPIGQVMEPIMGRLSVLLSPPCAENAFKSSEMLQFWKYVLFVAMGAIAFLPSWSLMSDWWFIPIILHHHVAHFVLLFMALLINLNVRSEGP